MIYLIGVFTLKNKSSSLILFLFWLFTKFIIYLKVPENGKSEKETNKLIQFLKLKNQREHLQTLLKPYILQSPTRLGVPTEELVIRMLVVEVGPPKRTWTEQAISPAGRRELHEMPLSPLQSSEYSHILESTHQPGHKQDWTNYLFIINN